MQNHKGFRRFICVTVLCALLMVSMGRATRVSAVGTTAAIAGTAFILTGAVYLSYVALTQGEMVLPAAEEMHNWLGGIGRKVSQYPSGASAYQELYQGLLKDPTANVIDGVWTWTQDRLKSFINDFSDTRKISEIVGYDAVVDTSTIPLNGFSYDFTIVNIPNYVVVENSAGATHYPLTQDTADYSDIMIVDSYRGKGAIVSINLPAGTYRNYKSGTSYNVQRLENGIWVDVWGNYQYGKYQVANPNYHYVPSVDYTAWYETAQSYSIPLTQRGYPLLANDEIYDADTDTTYPLVIPDSSVEHLPSWIDPDNDNRPIVPYVPIPDIPIGVPSPPEYTGPPKWGFPLAELLDLLEELAEDLINIDAIARLINEFAGQHGDNYYLEYNDGDTNYYTYYQPTVFDNDTDYVTYNINVSEQEEVIPVDLNTISLYTKNEYLDAVKQSARNFGNAIGEYVAFWHNSDYTLTYTILGGFVLILIGAFIGKWGHS